MHEYTKLKCKFVLDRLNVGFICFNLCCMWDLFVLIYMGIFDLSSFSIVFLLSYMSTD